VKVKWKWIIIFAVLILLIAAGTTLAVLSRRGLPEMEGEKKAPVNSEIVVYRDSFGIPYIKADNLDDLFFAQGYTQAQNRLWQMDLNRRATAGRLSEIFGEEFLETDYFLRSLLMSHAAEQAVEKLNPETRGVLEQFSAGVNFYIDNHLDNLSFEFLILDYTPEPWSVEDSLSIGKLMAWDLGGNMETELFLAAAIRLLPEDKALELFPTYPEYGPTVITGQQPNSILSTLQIITDIKTGRPSQEIGSNNWVVSGALTASGKPLLANDMHLGMGMPSIWYQTRLEIPEMLTLSGVIFPGVPGIIVGTNGHIAWGVTNVGPDVQDLYIERPHPEEDYLFEYDGQWEKAKVLDEEFHVRDWDEPANKEIIITRNGPIISGLEHPEEDTLSLRWTAQDHTEEIEAILRFAHARDWEAFRRALEHFHVPAQSFVFADREGTIAYKASGMIPIRRAGKGLFPVPGWDPSFQWEGFIPFEELPEIINPESGYIATANHKIVPEDYPYFITTEWAPPYRAMAIIQELESQSGLDVQSMKDLQYNVNNLHAEKLLPVLIQKLENSSQQWTEKESAALELLSSWSEQPVDNRDEAGPSIYHKLYLKMLEITFQENMGDKLYQQFLKISPTNTFDRMLLSEEKTAWFEDFSGGKQEVVDRAFSKAVSWLENRLGSDPETWTWGSLHKIPLDHNLDQIPLIGDYLNDGPFPLDGSHNTVAAASYPFHRPFYVTHSAPWRFVADLDNLHSNVWENMAGGVCEHPLSPHYRDQTPLWLEGDYLPVYLESSEMKKNTPGDEIQEYRFIPN